MHCQTCRTPLRLDPSLEHLNAASFKILADSASPPTTALPTQPTRRLYPPERKARYDAAATASASMSRPHGTGSPTISARPVPSPSIAAKENPAMSFVMLTESQLVAEPAQSRTTATPTSPSTSGSRAAHVRTSAKDAQTSADERDTPLSAQASRAARLFAILSAHSDVDHPVCAECAEHLRAGLAARLAAATKERDAYVGYVKAARSGSGAASAAAAEEARAQLERARTDERAAVEELERVEGELADAERELAEVEAQGREMDGREAEFWRGRNAFARTLAGVQGERDAVEAQLEHDAKQLERLQRTNVYNDMFSIGHDGLYGTINGLRLGRLSNPVVDWAEVNAAWGQTCLLLATVAEKLRFAFDGFRLRPMGSTSQIEKLEVAAGSGPGQGGSAPATTTNRGVSAAAPGPAPKSKLLALYSSGDLPLGLNAFDRRFDTAMIAFLECLRQLGAHVERTGMGVQGLKMPYAVVKDRVGDASIKYGFGNNEEWTKACKYTLTCCKYLLAHASNVSATQPKPDP